MPRFPTNSPGGGGVRAPRMSPDERREMLIAATLPLVSRHGRNVTTKQIAEAARVAEGTIFRVFPDKDALVDEAVARALDVEPVLAELAAVDMAAPVRDRVAQVIPILQRRFVASFELMIALGVHGPPPEVKRTTVMPRHAAILTEIERILAPDHEKFRCPVTEVVRIIRLLTISGSHRLITDGNLLTAAEIASVVLDGTLHHHHHHNHDEIHNDEREA